MNGVLVIDKPAGMTSHDVVNRARRILNERSIGHLGTLDPMATGVLPLVLGRLTRLAQFYTSSDKVYEGTIRFGYATDTYDADGEPLHESVIPICLTLEQLQATVQGFVGDIEQLPPPFSAKKINGVPAYKLARRKQDVQLQASRVHVYSFEITSLDGDLAGFRAHVSGGTYIRSLAHDLGQRLGCGAHLASLRRTMSGEFRIEDAHTLDDIQQALQDGASDQLFVHPRRLLPNMPTVTATEQAVANIRNGRPVNLPEMSTAKLVKVFQGQTELVAIASRIAGTLFQPKIVFSGE